MKNTKKIIFILILVVFSMFLFNDKVYAVDFFTEDTYTCTYEGKKNGEKLIVKYEVKSVNNVIDYNVDYSYKWYITYPGTSSVVEMSGLITKGNEFPSKACDDVFYSRKSNKILAVEENYYYKEQMINQYCTMYDDLEQFCANGKCKITNVACGNSTLETEWGTCPYILLPIVKFLKIVVFNTLQIFVPIILILMGTIELVKAVASSDDKAISGATGKLIKKVLIAILIFFVTTIVSIVMNALASADIEGFEDWKACWFYNDTEGGKSNEE